MFSISVVEGDILNRNCDLLVLKHADAFAGIDMLVAKKIDFNSAVPAGEVRLVAGKGTSAMLIAFVGVGPLEDFDYPKIRNFGRRAIEIASEQIQAVERVCMPIHGPGYGLDEAEAFSSLVAGIVDAAADKGTSKNIKAVEIVEFDPARAQRCQAILDRLVKSPEAFDGPATKSAQDLLSARQALEGFGPASKSKVRLFVAMPFNKTYSDEWDIAIPEAANPLQMLCERIDRSAFTGDITAEIKRRIEECDGLIALLNDANPNVFLEVGYAWAKGKPTLLLAKVGQELPFDVRGERCIFYESIRDLREKLRSELAQLQSNDVFRRV
jgi:hypothetical protein